VVAPGMRSIHPPAGYPINGTASYHPEVSENTP
jgi:hypothetical protein